MLIIIIHLAHRFGDNFRQSDTEIEQRFGLSKSSIKKARKELSGLGFISYKRGFSIGKLKRSTRYTYLPDQKLRVELRIREGPKRADMVDSKNSLI
jgi:DNA-binding MarR family transcriptional regulator